MIERIDLFMPPKSQYRVLHSFTISMARALDRCGVRCRVLEAERDNPKKFIDQLFADPPECTLSFNGLLPDEEGRFFSELIHIPHIACLVDAPQHFLPLIRCSNTIITCVDRFYCDFFEGLKFDKVLFMPHAADKEMITPLSADENRPYDVLMLASFIDHEAIRKTWKKDLGSALAQILEDAAEITLVEKETPYVQALAQALDQHAREAGGFDPSKLDFVLLLDQLENYINGKDRMELLKAIKDVPVHLYGADIEGWEKYLGKQSNIIFHEAVSYEQALSLMRRSKIVLNSRPSVKNGAHERIFAGLASGAAVVTSENKYIHENFRDGENILFYRHGNWKELNNIVNTYVEDETKRFKLASEGQATVAQNHTWDHRAAVLLNELPPILEQLTEIKL